MKNAIIICLLLVSTGLFAQNLPPLPECYHNNAEIYAHLQEFEAQYPNFARIYTIGHSQQDNLPIYALKISDNVAVDEQVEPAVMFAGQIHAEEVIGIEITLYNIQTILENRLQTPYSSWIANLEMWFLPTLNPEGHDVVTSNLDVSYRKNKHDLNNDGILNFSENVGYDADGVDINRNFAFNWCHGDTLYQQGSTEQWDYYRGEAPMSESETLAIKAFCDAQKPIYSIIWHSARNVNGGLQEKVYYPVNYAETRPCPDLALSQQIGVGVANQILMQDGSAPYQASASMARKGGANDYMYQQYGSICLVIECGTNDIQPDSLMMMDTVLRCSNGVWWLLNRALPFSQTMPSSSLLKGTVKEAGTMAPLEAEIIVEERHAPWFAPRTSFPETGNFCRPLNTGTYTLRFRKKGYQDLVMNAVNVNNGSWTTVSAVMTPLPAATVNLSVSSSGIPIPANVVWYDLENDIYDFTGDVQIHTWQGSHRIEISADGYFPYIGTHETVAGNQDLHIELSAITAVQIIFSEDWESGMDGWIKNSNWVIQNELAVDGSALTDSWGGKGFYARDCNVWIRTANPVYIPASDTPLLTFDQQVYTEFVYDSVRVEISADTLTWQMIYTDNGQHDWWHPVYIPLGDYAGTNRYFRFRLTDISNHIDLTEPGWTIDNIRIIRGTSTPVADSEMLPAPDLITYPIYPNPFNPETNISFYLGKQNSVSIDIYNVKGQKVKNMTKATLDKGIHNLKWDGKDDQGTSTGTGIYFCRIKAGHMSRSLKMVLMK